ncbi:Tubulin-folding cofactor E [Aphelenchoides besseyi]|nr:Tubulin-folding cofactor E [Aphelenchoides besseyi]KAI6212174.1 Tubulin-folding cofactor E [Aphelenchoides besseyi]
MDKRIEINQRVGVGNRRGVVKFVGRVDGSDEARWIGVDWDNLSDGKNDGTVKGKRYFEAKSPTSGSFVKPKDVVVGQGLRETLYDRYCSTSDEKAGEVEGVQIVLKEGEEGLNVLQRTFTINLDNLYISYVESDFELKFPKCVSLSMANNLLSDWNQLFAILDLFPKLQVLNLSFNVFLPLPESVVENRRHDLHELVMNNCGLVKSELAKIGRVFHELKSLIVLENNLSEVDLSQNFDHLTNLHICRNPIGDFKKLWPLGQLPRLESLNLRGCEIPKIELPSEPSFQQLSVLFLAENPINDWESINAVGSLPRLKNFRSSGLHAGERGCQSYEMIVAKLPYADVVDGCIINAEERKNCELMFLFRFYQPPQLPVHQSDIERLAKIYGTPEPTEDPTKKNDNLCSFVLIYGNKRIQRKLPLHLDIKRLVMFASRPLGFSASDIKVVVQIMEDYYETFEWNSSTLLRALEPPSNCRMSKEEHRKILEVRLEARSITISYAAVYFHKLNKKIPTEFCLHTIACACMSLAAKATNDYRIKIRHVVTVSHRILHPDKPVLPIGDLESDLRKSFAQLEQVVLRLLGFDLEVKLPHNFVYLISASLRDYFPNELADSNKFNTTIGTLLQDASVDPDFFFCHNAITSAIVVISLAFQILEIPIKDIQWTPIFNQSLSIHRLQKLKRRFLRLVYEEKI